MSLLSCRVTATDGAGSATLVSNAATVTEPASGFDPATLFSSGQAGMVLLPGSAYTDCYVEATGTPPTTLCTHNSTVGSIHDKVRNTWTRISTSSARPLYQIASGKHSLVLDGINDSVPVYGAVAASAIEAFMALNLNGDTTGILMGASGYNFADYLGVFQSGSASTNIAARNDVDATIAIRIDGATASVGTRGAFYTALGSSNRRLGMRYAGTAFPSVAWQTGIYSTGSDYPQFGHSSRIYGLIARFNDDFTAGEIADVETLLAGQLP